MNAKKLMWSILFGAAAVTLAGMMARETFAASPANPDPAANRMLADFMKTGAKIYYMGEELGLQGWFIANGNQVQIAYTQPDNKASLVGVLFDAQGNSITSQQMKTLYDNNKEVNAILTGINNQQQVPTVPAQTSFPGMPQMLGSVAAATSNSGAPFQAPNPPSLSPGEQLMQALQNAAGVDVGSSAAPKLFMVVDPNCPHCHEAWQAMRTAVFGGKIQVRLVPVGAFGPDSERASAQLLHVADPLNAWDKYIGGDQSQLAGTPDPSAVAAVQNNRTLIDAWHIQMTPYIIYRAKNGQAKIVQGEPLHSDSVIDDMAP